MKPTMGVTPVVIVTPTRGPLATAIRKVLELLCHWQVEIGELEGYTREYIRGAELILVIPQRDGPRPWDSMRALLGHGFRGHIVIWQGISAFRGLEREGVYAAESCRCLVPLAEALTARQFAFRTETRNRATLDDTNVLKRLANGDHHVVPSFEGVFSLLGGAAEDMRRASRELATGQSWVERFSVRPKLARTCAACATELASLREMVDADTSIDAGSGDGRLSNSDRVNEARAIAARWALAWHSVAVAAQTGEEEAGDGGDPAGRR